VCGMAPKSSTLDSNCNREVQCVIIHLTDVNMHMYPYPVCLYHLFKIHAERTVPSNKDGNVRSLSKNKGKRLDRHSI
jgi:hypothetical protein